MKDFMAKKSAGFYFTIVATILFIVGTVMYTSVMYTNTVVFVMLALAIIWEVPVIGAVLAAAAAVWGAELMVNQIGYVIAGLDEMGTIMSFIYYEVVMVVTLLVCIICSFLKQTKDN